MAMLVSGNYRLKRKGWEIKANYCPFKLNFNSV
jgi:hypothetical protein